MSTPVIGRAFLYVSGHVAPGRETVSPTVPAAGQMQRFREAMDAVRAELTAQTADNEIFAAHLEMLDDPMLSDSVAEGIDSGLDAAAAVQQACEAISAMFAEIDDEYLRARVDDVRDICSRIVSALDGNASRNVDIPQGAVVFAEELLPSDTARMDLSRVAAFVVHKGSRTSHVCLIARSRGIPVITGYESISSVRDNCMAAVDADADEVILDPTEAQLEDFSRRIASAQSEGFVDLNPPVNRYGRKVPVYANAGSVDDIRCAVSMGADGIGLLRTEFVFMESDALPDEEKQFNIYRDAVLACEGRPLTVRTLDIGGDKSLPYMPLPSEENPFLGKRGIRLCLADPELLKVQLRAIARASEYGPVKVMFPMISTIGELRSARALVALPSAVKVGMMIETPAAVLCAADFARECDFFSIGTNDLTQYVMAADRGNSSVSDLYDCFDPAVVRAVRMTVEAAHSCGIEVGMCGDMASEPSACAMLMEMGLDSLSVPAPEVQNLKKLINEK